MYSVCDYTSQAPSNWSGWGAVMMYRMIVCNLRILILLDFLYPRCDLESCSHAYPQLTLYKWLMPVCRSNRPYWTLSLTPNKCPKYIRQPAPLLTIIPTVAMATVAAHGMAISGLFSGHKKWCCYTPIINNGFRAFITLMSRLWRRLCRDLHMSMLGYRQMHMLRS